MSEELVKRLRFPLSQLDGGPNDEELWDRIYTDREEAADRIEALENLFPAILEYLEQHSDVLDGDNGIPHPNAAMSLLVWTRHILEKEAK